MDPRLFSHMLAYHRQATDIRNASAARNSGQSVLCRIVTVGQKETLDMWASRINTLPIFIAATGQNADGTFQWLAGYDAPINPKP